MAITDDQIRKLQHDAIDDAAFLQRHARERNAQPDARAMDNLYALIKDCTSALDPDHPDRDAARARCASAWTDQYPSPPCVAA